MQFFQYVTYFYSTLLFHYIYYVLIHILHLIQPIGCNINKRVCRPMHDVAIAKAFSQAKPIAIEIANGNDPSSRCKLAPKQI